MIYEGMKLRMIAKEGHSMQRQTHDSRQDGSVMLVVMIICGILMLSSAAILAMAANSSFRMRRQLHDAQALQIAEAGIADMIGRLSENYVSWQNSTNTASFAGGRYRVTSRTNPGGNVLIESEGSIHSATRNASVELLGTDRDQNDTLFSVDGAILSGGDVRFRTAAFTIRGGVHSNQRVTSSSGAHNGDFFAGIDNDSPGHITAVGTIGNLNGQHTENAPARELPSFNFDSYRALAKSGGIYLEGDQTLRNWNGAPGNGVVYVNGNVTIRNNSSLKGTLVANGDITLRNNFTQSAYSSGMPALLATGNLNMDNRGRIEGVVYAGVNTYISNNVNIMGGIISVGFTDINNNSDIYHPSEYPDWDPLQPSIPPEVIVGGWLR